MAGPGKAKQYQEGSNIWQNTLVRGYSVMVSTMQYVVRECSSITSAGFAHSLSNQQNQPMVKINTNTKYWQMFEIIRLSSEYERDIGLELIMNGMCDANVFYLIQLSLQTWKVTFLCLCVF